MRQLAPTAISTLSSCFDAAADVLSEKLIGRAVLVFQDDLPSVSVSRLRATGAITAEMTRTIVAGVEVDLDLVRFANGGSWSFFLCPQCGQRSRTLKLFEGCVLCWRCCHQRGARYRVKGMTPRRRAERRIPRLRAMLESPTSLRLKPSTLWGKMERRSRMEAALRVRLNFMWLRVGLRELGPRLSVLRIRVMRRISSRRGGLGPN
jgi:hypothetical protein